MILGDNFFHGQGFSTLLIESHQNFTTGACVHTYQVDDPSRYGVAEVKNGKIVSVVEKPTAFISNFAITGMYSFDGTVSERARKLKPSPRNETEIVDLIRSYIDDNSLENLHLGRGFVWFDVGTPESLLSASNYVEVIQSRQGTCIASPEEVAWRMKYISLENYLKLINAMPNGQYKQMLLKSTTIS
ncbi:Glucose-1-phosphate thymidylyltransferase 1 [compost metagenome]